MAARLEDKLDSNGEPRLERSGGELVSSCDDANRNRKLGHPDKPGDDGFGVEKDFECVRRRPKQSSSRASCGRPILFLAVSSKLGRPDKPGDDGFGVEKDFECVRR